jgi:hypothetical protein
MCNNPIIENLFEEKLFSGNLVIFSSLHHDVFLKIENVPKRNTRVKMA